LAPPTLNPLKILTSLLYFSNESDKFHQIHLFTPVFEISGTIKYYLNLIPKAQIPIFPVFLKVEVSLHIYFTSLTVKWLGIIVIDPTVCMVFFGIRFGARVFGVYRNHRQSRKRSQQGVKALTTDTDTDTANLSTAPLPTDSNGTSKFYYT